MRLFLTLAFVLASLFGSAAFAQEKPANVVFITIDTLRSDHLSSWGYHLKTSPNIDKLAEQGLRYENAYTVTSRTAPSHYSMFTSRYPQEHGAKLNGFAVPLETKFLFLPQIFQRHGYENGAFVSAWPLTARLTKLDRFFDTYDEDLSRKYQTINSMRWAEDVAPRAISWMRSHQEDPFFLWVHFFDPHSPYDFREEFDVTETTGAPDHTRERGQDVVMEDLRAYNSEIRYTDHYVGQIIDAVDEMGLGENTLIVLTADHGESIGEREYQGHSRRLWESIVRVPLIMRWTGKIEPGRVETSKVSTIDIMPTVVDMTIKKSHPDAAIPTEYAGRSLAANALESSDLPDRVVRFVAFAGQKWMMPKWLAKLWLRDLNFPLRVGYRQDDKKVIWTPENEALQIVHLNDDPFAAHPEAPEEGSRTYERETETMTRWFEATHLELSGDNEMTSEDRDALKSLGYIQ